MDGKHHTTPWRGARAQRAAALGLGLSIGLAAAVGPAQADKVGVAAAVNPDAFSSLSGTPNKQLNIGKSIFFNERINTTNSGLVQVLLVDGSTFTVGPNSNLVIDKFVYDPRKKTGELVATFSKGTMRFIGGKLSKNEGGVTVNTPDGALAIRGGMFQGSTSRRVYSFLFGHSLTFRGTNGQTQTVYEAGYTLDLSGGGANVRPTTSQDINTVMAALTNGSGGGLGGTGGQPDTGGGPGVLQQANADSSSVDELISDANATHIQDEIQNQINNQTNTQPPGSNKNNQQQTGNPAPIKTVPLPSEFTLRVLASPDFYVANRYSFWHSTAIPTPWSEDEDTPGSHGILGGDNKWIPCRFAPAGACGEGQRFFQVTTDDHEVEADIAGGRATGRIPQLIDRDGRRFELTEEAQFDVPIFNTPGPHSFSNGTLTEVVDGVEQIIPLSGVAFTGRDGGFFAYQMFRNNDKDSPILAFGGNAFQKPEAEPAKVRLFNLYSDARQGIAIPFASKLFAPSDTSQASVSPLYLLETTRAPAFEQTFSGAAVDNSDISGVSNFPRKDPAVWVQTSYLALGEGADQQSILVLALGTQNEDGSLTGVRRGSAAFSLSAPNVTEMVAFSGDISTLSGPDGAHLIGNTVPHIVIGADSTGHAHTIFKDETLFQGDGSGSVGATYHIGEQIASIDTKELAQTPGDYYGYAAGVYQEARPGALEVDSFSNSSSDQVHFRFKEDNRLSALFSLSNSDDSTGLKLAFGDWDLGSPRNRTGHSAFISDQIYAATEANIQSTVSLEDYVFPRDVESTTYLASSGLVNPEVALCTNCDFMRWGAWGGQIKYKDRESHATSDINLGWYVVGDIVDESDLPDRGSATYKGNAIGTVANNIDGEGWKTYVATGKADLTWDFAPRTGTFKITEFDKSVTPGGLTFLGPMCAPGVACSGAPNHSTPRGNHFGGPLSGNAGGIALAGSAQGSFVRGPANFDLKGLPIRGGIPQGAIGDWNVRGAGLNGAGYKATGIFGLKR
jgi:FecR protein